MLLRTDRDGGWFQMERNKFLAGNRVCVLLSGGLDSAACVEFYLRRAYPVTTIFVDYGQAAARQEESASGAVAAHYKVERLVVRLQAARPKHTGLILGRNAFLLCTALLEFGAEARFVAAGIHSRTSYGDCSEAFVGSMQHVFDAYTEGVTRIVAPFLLWTKRDIWAFCKTNSVPIELTYSCESGGETHCGRCLSCRDLEILRAA